MWPKGPWSDEPDEVIWIDEATQLPCHIKRHKEFWNLWGYLYAPASHYRRIHLDTHLKVDYPITYRDLRGEYYVIGFHPPPLRKLTAKGWTINTDALSNYKEIDYLINECKKLARQVKERHLIGK